MAWHFFKKINVILQKMFRLGFRNFRPIFLKSTFLIATFFSVFFHLFELIIVLLTLGDKGVRVSANPFVRSKMLWNAQIFQWVQTSKWKTYFTQFIDKFLKFEEIEY